MGVPAIELTRVLAVSSTYFTSHVYRQPFRDLILTRCSLTRCSEWGFRRVQFSGRGSREETI